MLAFTFIPFSISDHSGLALALIALVLLRGLGILIGVFKMIRTLRHKARLAG